MTPDKILTVFKEATENFGDISVKPTDDVMSCTNRTLLPILLNIPYDQVDATHNLSGLIIPSAKYKTKYGTAFNRPTPPGPYCPTITTTISDTDRRKSKSTHSSRKEEYQLYKAAYMGIMCFLTTIFNDT